MISAVHGLFNSNIIKIKNSEQQREAWSAVVFYILSVSRFESVTIFFTCIFQYHDIGYHSYGGNADYEYHTGFCIAFFILNVKKLQSNVQIMCRNNI